MPIRPFVSGQASIPNQSAAAAFTRRPLYFARVGASLLPEFFPV